MGIESGKFYVKNMSYMSGRSNVGKERVFSILIIMIIVNHKINTENKISTINRAKFTFKMMQHEYNWTLSLSYYRIKRKNLNNNNRHYFCINLINLF